MRSCMMIIYFALMFTFPPLLHAKEATDHPLTLKQTLSLALKNNLDISLATIDKEYVRADMDRAKSTYDTALTATIDYEDNELKPISSLIGSDTETTHFDIGLSKKFASGTTLGLDFTNKRNWTDSDYASVNPAYDSAVKLTLTQSLGKNFFGLIDRGEIKATLFDIQKQDLATLDNIEASLAETEKHYWQLAFSQEIVALRREMHERADHLYTIYLDKLERGTAEEADVYASEANVTMRKIDLDIAQNIQKNAVNQLCVTLNLPAQENLSATDALAIEPTAIDMDDSIYNALEWRRDLLKAKKDVEAKNIRLAMKRNNRWPEVDLTASYMRNGLEDNRSDALSAITDAENPDYYLGMAVSFPLENRHARSEHKKALLDKKRALINLKKLENTIIADLDKKVRAVNLAREKVVQRKTIAELQEKKLAEEDKRFGYGRSNSDTLIRFQDDVLTAKIALFSAYLDYHTSRVEHELAQNALLKKVGLE